MDTNPLSLSADMSHPMAGQMRALTPSGLAMSLQVSQSQGSPGMQSITASSSSSNLPRRPPRKSTLTQQQKNQKRQRATQDQLVTLEVEFNKNPTPTAAVREQIAQNINMTERSVQIWFQNKRAKIKLLAKKSIETGEDCESIPESMRQYLANQAFESGKPLSRDMLIGAGVTMGAYGGGMLIGDTSQAGKIVIHHFTCKSLSVGTWRRVGQNAMDLVVFYAPDKGCLTYYINNEGAGYKIEYPFSYIKNISLESDESAEEITNTAKLGGIRVELNRPPNFFMDSAGTGGFHQCGDFTEEQQASTVMVHRLGGHPKVLGGQLAKLVSTDSFQNRHNTFDRQAIAASAPVSPMAPTRPSSQPAHPNFSNPHLAIFEQQGFGMAPPARGHRRQRSRSVPIAVDFSAMGPIPSLHLSKPSVNMADNDNLFSPIPQSGNNHLISFDNTFRLDTGTGYGLDYRQFPLAPNATSTAADFANTSQFNGNHMQALDTISSSNFNPSYGLPFLSPMSEHIAQGLTSSSSNNYSFNHGDPIITNGSPPMGDGLQRSASADFLSMNAEHQTEGLLLDELYPKQIMNLPVRPSNTKLETLESYMHEDTPSEDLDMTHILHFNDATTSSLSPETGIN